MAEDAGFCHLDFVLLLSLLKETNKNDLNLTSLSSVREISVKETFSSFWVMLPPVPMSVSQQRPVCEHTHF